MDTFDLRWPQTTATFCTNGWRCRIVWRGKKGGMGGTIENNELCKRRVADSLEGAPQLLDELRAAGFVDLANEIQTLAPLSAVRLAPGTAQRPATTQAAPPPKLSPAPGELIDRWASALGSKALGSKAGPQVGSADWQACSDRRARNWLAVAQLDVTVGDDTWREDVLLKTPAKTGKQEWVLKCFWLDGPKGDARATPRYYAAGSFNGICRCIASQRAYRTVEFVDAFINGVGELVSQYPEVAEAVDGWAGQKALAEKPQSVH